MLNVGSGYRTYLTGIIMIGVGIARALGLDIPGFETIDPGLLITNGLAFIFVRNAISGQ